MGINRRTFIRNSMTGGIAATIMPLSGGITLGKNPGQEEFQRNYASLSEIVKQPVFKRELFSSPVLIESVELLRDGGSFLCRVRSEDGAEGISAGHPWKQSLMAAFFLSRQQPFFIGKDARDLEILIDEFYVNNYKHQGLGIWVPQAMVEFAILDMMGKIAGKPVGELIGEIHNSRIGVYFPNNNRGRSPEESLERIQMELEGSNVKALKYKIAGRMRTPDDPPGRSEELIPLVREAFGDEMVLYVDANGGYTVDEAIRVGKILEEYRYDWYEEPVPFDDYEETRWVAQALSIPFACGDQEISLNKFRWFIAGNVVQTVQPDQFYFGGMIRSMRVARMADAFGIKVAPHMSNRGLGYLYMLHFVSAVPNAGPYQEAYRNNRQNGTPVECETSSLVPDTDGRIKVPTGPGLGVEIDPDFIARHELVSSY